MTGRGYLAGCLYVVLGVVGWLVLGFTIIVQDPCMPFCIAVDEGTGGTLSSVVLALAGAGCLGVLVLVIMRRHSATVWLIPIPALGVVFVLAFLGLLGVDAVTADPSTCSC